MADDNTPKTYAVNIETIEDLEDFETPRLHPVGDQFGNSVQSHTIRWRWMTRKKPCMVAKPYETCTQTIVL